MEMQQIQIGRVYRYFKGNYYSIENIAIDLETQERMVNYKCLYQNQDSQIWIRPEKKTI